MYQIAIFVTAVLLLGLLLLGMIEIGRRLGIRRRKRAPELANDGVSTVDGAIYGLLGLLLAFTFSGAAARFDARRQLVVQETNAIGTAYLRVDLLPAAMQPAVKRDFRDYVDARLGYYRERFVNSAAATADGVKVQELQGKIWSESVAGCHEAGSPAATSLVLSSLNDMIDITTTRAVAAEMHPPLAIYLALGSLVFAGSLLAGDGTAGAKKRSWAHLIIFAGIMALAVYTILDLEYPRVGIIRIDAIDHVLMDLRKTM
jgi:hypothetical protein